MRNSAVREHLANLQGPPIGISIPGCIVRPTTRTDATTCDLLCHSVHGHERGRDLRDAVDRGAASVVERNGRITGYTTQIAFFGHAVAETNDDLKALIAVAPSFAGPGFLLPSRNTELFQWCLAHGLRMVHDDHRPVQRTERCPPAIGPVLNPLNVSYGSRAAVVAMLMVRPVCPQIRKCHVQPRSYAWCHKPTLTGPRHTTAVDPKAGASAMVHNAPKGLIRMRPQ
jgi:hypothetical protein